MNDLCPSTTNSSPSWRTVVVIARRSEPTSGSVRPSAPIASSRATRGSHSWRSGSAAAVDTGKLPMPCIAKSESRWALTPASTSRTTVTASESTASNRPPYAAATVTSASPEAASLAPVGVVGAGGDVGAGQGEGAGLILQLPVAGRQFEEGAFGGHEVPLAARSGRWLNVRPSNSEAIRTRWIAGVPPAMAQPWASRCSRSKPYSSV